MKVLHLLQSNRFSGAENVVCQIISMVKDEPEIDMVYCSRDGQIREALNERGVKFVPINSLSVPEVKRVIMEQKPDIIHAHDMRASFVAARACGNIPLISHIHVNNMDFRVLPLKSIVYLFAAIKADRIFWVSKSAYKGYAFHRFIEKKSMILDNIINIDDLYKRMATDNKKYDYDIIFLGRITFQKNPQRLIRIIAKVAAKVPNVKAAIVGTGDLYDEAKELCKEMNLCNNVFFLGYQNNPVKILHDSKVMVMTSRFEGMPICALEAMALGVPIVSTPTDGLCELIEDGKDGFISNDDNELAERVIEVITDSDLRNTLSANAKEKAQRINSLEAYKSKLLEEYTKYNKKKVVFSFIVQEKNKGDHSVTESYLNLLKEACQATKCTVEFIPYKNKPSYKLSYIVTDTFLMALYYHIKGYRHHIVWLQGIIPEESYMRNHSEFRYWVLSFLEKLVIKKADLLLLVSDEMKQHYEKKYKCDLSNKSIVIPCFSETMTNINSFSQKKYEENSFVYVGGLHVWQCFEQTVHLYAQIEKLAPTPTKLYVFTLNKEKAIQTLLNYGVVNYEVDYAEKEELSNRLKGIKYGFVLREDCVVNNVATPTKISNYLANGIIPIYSSSLKSFAQFDKKNQLGIVYDLDKPEEGLQRILEHMKMPISSSVIRQKCETAFSSYYNIDNYRKEITKKLFEIIHYEKTAFCN